MPTESSSAMLETYLQLAASREKTISSNMANVDTPGYRTRDIDFESELNKATSRASFALSGGSDLPQMLPVIRQVQGLMERPDGNDVSLDREALRMAETQLRYQLGIQLLKRHFHQILNAMNGGS